MRIGRYFNTIRRLYIEVKIATSLFNTIRGYIKRKVNDFILITFSYLS